MMEKLGQAKTHLELKKMIAEVDTNNSGRSTYIIVLFSIQSSMHTYKVMYDIVCVCTPCLPQYITTSSQVSTAGVSCRLNQDLKLIYYFRIK